MAEVISYSLFSEFDIDLFKSGKHYRLYEKFGSHPVTLDGVSGTYFAVWAPSAESVSVIGDFNYWNEKQHLFASHKELSYVFKEEIGNSADINIMLYQLLKKIDIEVYPVVLSTREHGY